MSYGLTLTQDIVIIIIIWQVKIKSNSIIRIYRIITIYLDVSLFHVIGKIFNYIGPKVHNFSHSIEAKHFLLDVKLISYRFFLRRMLTSDAGSSIFEDRLLNLPPNQNTLERYASSTLPSPSLNLPTHS